MLVYGRGAASIAMERGMPLSEAEALMANFFRQMPKVEKWLNATRELAVRAGYLVSPLGRVRRFGLVNQSNRHRVITQATNCPVQATSSDVCDEASVRMEEWGRATGLCRVLLLVHDNVIAECREEVAQQVADKLEEIMQQSARDLLGPDSVPFDTDVSIGKSWGDL